MKIFGALYCLPLVLSFTPQEALPESSPDSPPQEAARTRFLAEESVTFAERARDLFVAGQDVRLRGEVEDNLFAAGEDLVLERNAKLMGDVFAAAEQLTIDSHIDGDLYAAGESVRLTQDGSIAGNVYAAGESVLVEGTIQGELFCAAEKLVVDGAVEGDVHAKLERLMLGPNGRIGGELSYSAKETAIVPESFRLGGTTTFYPRESRRERVSPLRVVLYFLMSWLGFWLLGMALRLVSNQRAKRPSRILGEQALQSALLGAAVFITTPILALIFLFVPFLGAIGLALIFAYALALTCAFPVVSACLGDWLAERFGKMTLAPWQRLALGIFVLLLVTRIPYLGALILIGSLIFGLGAIARALIENRVPADEEGVRHEIAAHA